MSDREAIGTAGERPRLEDIEARLDRPRRSGLWRAALAVLILLALYYPIGMILMHHIDDDPNFDVPIAPGASKAVAVAAGLIERETTVNGWRANDPFFMPSALLDNMPNFQQGIVYALSRFAIEMGDQIGRVRGSSQVDPDLDKAAGRLKFPGTVWVFEPSTSWMPTTTSEKQYQAGMRALLSYNERLAAGDATFDARADNLQATLERIAADLGSASASIDRHIKEVAFFLDRQSDDIFYQNKGRIYAYYLLLRALRDDFGQLVTERGLDPAWDQMLETFRMASALDPLVILNGAPDSLLVPSHLAAQGFYLLRARTQLKEIANILLK